MRARRFGGRRPRKRYLWTGLSATGIPVATGGSLTVFDIVIPSDISTIADITVEKSFIEFVLINSDESQRYFALYMSTVETGLDEAPVGAALWDPLAEDIDYLQKRTILWQRGPMYVGAGDVLGTAVAVSGAQTLLPTPIEVNVKRRLKGENALVLVASGSAGGSLSMSLQVRTLLSVGRR